MNVLDQWRCIILHHCKDKFKQFEWKYGLFLVLNAWTLHLFIKLTITAQLEYFLFHIANCIIQSIFAKCCSRIFIVRDLPLRGTCYVQNVKILQLYPLLDNFRFLLYFLYFQFSSSTLCTFTCNSYVLYVHARNVLYQNFLGKLFLLYS